MKTLRYRWVNTVLNLVARPILFICLISLITSCSKPKAGDNGPAGAFIQFINIIPKTSSVDFFIDNAKVNTLLMPFSQKTDYVNINEGQRKLDITFGSAQSIASDLMNLDAGKFYSIFAIGKGPYEIYATLDDRSAPPPSGKVKVRFINLSPDAPNMDFGITGGATLFTDQAYKSASAFVNIDPSNLNLFIRQTGTSTVKATKIDAFFDSDGIYTVIAMGLWSSTGSDPKVEIGVIRHK